MKKLKIALWITMLVLVLGAVAGAMIYVYRMPATDREAMVAAARAFVAAEGGSAVVQGATSASVIAAVLVPVIKGARLFAEATSSVQGTESSSREAVALMVAWKKEMREEQFRTLEELAAGQAALLERLDKEQTETLQAMLTMLEATLASMKTENGTQLSELKHWVGECTGRMDGDHETVAAISEAAEQIKAMLLVGMCNQPDLVASGKGRKISALAEGRIRPQDVIHTGVLSMPGSGDGKEGAHGQG